MTRPEKTYSTAASSRAFVEAQKLMPGGVSSPVRAFKAVGRDPIFIRQGKGPRVTDLDGNIYIDYVGSYGPLILGHAADNVTAAITKAAAKGTSFGAPTEAESLLAQMIVDLLPSIQQVRFVNSGTEAVMSAIRLARAATGRSRIIKFTGCYHGHSDGLLVQAGSGATTLGIPSSPGVPDSVTQDTILVPYNDLDAARAAFTAHGEIAAVVVEPIAGNMGLVLPVDGFLPGLRALCDDAGAVLIFDEVMSGFRAALPGAQQLLGVVPDLTCLGKVIGGGLPCAAYGGRTELMQQVAPQGPVYQAGTLSGNPLAMAAGIATLETLIAPGVYERLTSATAELADGLEKAAAAAGLPLQVPHVGSMICAFFSDKPIRSYEAALTCDTAAFAQFFNRMLEGGVMLPPSQYETWFVSTAHDEACLAQTLTAARLAFEQMVARQSSRVT